MVENEHILFSTIRSSNGCTNLYLIRSPQLFEWSAPRKSRLTLCRIVSLHCLRCSANPSNLSSTMFCSPETTEAPSKTQFIQFFLGRPIDLLPLVGVNFRRYLGIRVPGILETCPYQHWQSVQAVDLPLYLVCSYLV